MSEDNRKFTSPGQAMDASDTAREAATRVPEANINPPVEDGNANEHIVVSNKDKALEAAKQEQLKKDDAELSEGKK